MSDSGWANDQTPQPPQAPPSAPPPTPASSQQIGNRPWGFNSASNPWSYPRGFWPAVPGQQPYLPTQGTRAYRDWGTPDLILRGGMSYRGGVAPWPMPQPNEIPGLMHTLTQQLGRTAPPGIAMPAIAAGTAYGRYAAAGAMMAMNPEKYAAGLRARQEYDYNQFRMNAAVTAQRLADLARDYGAAYAEFGGGYDASGNKLAVDHDKLDAALKDAALKHNDSEMLNLLRNGQYDAAERRAQFFDNRSQDYLKTLQIQTQLEKLRAAQAGAEMDRAAGIPNADDPDSPPPQQEQRQQTPAAGGDQIPPRPQLQGLPPLSDPQLQSRAREPQPVQTAQADTGTATDAPPPGAQRLAGAPPAQVSPQAAQRPSRRDQDATAAPPSSGNIAPGFDPLSPVPVLPHPTRPQPPPPPQRPQLTRRQPPAVPSSSDSGITIEPDHPGTGTPQPTPNVDRVPPLPPMHNRAEIERLFGTTQDEIDYEAVKYLETGQMSFRGGSGGSARYNQDMAKIVRDRAAQMIGYYNQIFAANKQDIAAAAANAQNQGRSFHGWDEATRQHILDRLGEVDPDMAATLGGILRGDLPLASSGYAANSPYWRVARGWAFRVDPSFNPMRYETNRRTRIAFNSGTMYPAQLRRATDTTLMHALQLAALARGLHNDNNTYRNKVVNWAKTAFFGDPSVTNFDAVISHVSQELTRAFRGNAGAEADIHRELGNINSSSSPAQIAGYLQNVAQLLHGQMTALADLWNRGTGEHVSAEDMLSPQAQQAYNELMSIRTPTFDPSLAARYRRRGAFPNVQLDDPTAPETATPALPINPPPQSYPQQNDQGP